MLYTDAVLRFFIVPIHVYFSFSDEYLGAATRINSILNRLLTIIPVFCVTHGVSLQYNMLLELC